ncbi:kunitz-type protease inhibitor 1-like [Cyprinodon tularosa]|uniref:kunitz-type protease inhibitor 1-like n=1 Tax=Cyprinodon tularosa TaxID=77115 RepID=UPI0018E26B02|nr:kunitz-type protease inhibitor 1-like [Cyprinodon tularosa]
MVSCRSEQNPALSFQLPEMFWFCWTFSALLLCGARRVAAEECGAAFRSGRENFVLDLKDAVGDGAALLDTRAVSVDEDCQDHCCTDPRCNLALLKPRDENATENTRTCVLIDCVHKNRFVCRFVNQAGYQSYIRESMFQRYLQAPGEQPPPIANAGRDVVVQPGETVTLNGTESVALGNAKIATYRWSLQSGDRSLKMENTDLLDQQRLSNLQPGSYVLKLTVTDSNGRSGEDEVSVLVLSSELSSSYCLAPVKVGPCRAAFPRWRYKVETGSCEKFTFGGCKPNNNNFLSEWECLLACRGVTVSSERSVTLPTTTECSPVCRPDQLTCDERCCLDWTLECDGVKQCSDGTDENSCSELSQTFSRLLSINVSEKQARCVEPPRTGPCRASFTRWYYDPTDRKCQSFTFGGCDGNDNNFEEESKCSETCKGVTEQNLFSKGMFERLGTDEDVGESGSVALAVVLAVAILALLAILGYCFFRRRRNPSSRPPGPPHVELSQEDSLVYNSTTKPA